MKTISIEAEAPHDPGSLFQLSIDGKIVAVHLTAVQTHILVGDILEKVALPKPSSKQRAS
jgi:hypothetical protein